MKRLDKIKPLQNDMLNDLKRLVKYNSEKSEPLENMPFGKANAQCLNEALTIANEMGFNTTNMQNYCGYAEIGSGKDIIGLCAHLDIVPAGEGWNTNPFELTQKGNVVYGRGVSDDKGAVIASLYAMKLIKESGIKLNKRIRLLMGCNEETGSKCMEYYSKHGEPITTGFTPDGDFPGIHGEKGGLNLLAHSKNTKIISMNGGFVSNAVCNRCKTVIPKDLVDINALKNELSKTPLVDFTLTSDNDNLTIEAVGVSAHASTPNQGVNAAGYTMTALKCAGVEDDFVDFYTSYIGTNNNGDGIGCNICDKYGDLTLNNGIVKTENGEITCTIDIRYPVTKSSKEVLELIKPYMDCEQGYITVEKCVEPLFYDEDSKLVKSLLKAYQDVTGDLESKPMVIGGGTYAKEIPGIIAFGCAFLGDDNHIHDANELLKIDDLLMQVDIYVEAILNLLND